MGTKVNIYKPIPGNCRNCGWTLTLDKNYLGLVEHENTDPDNAFAFKGQITYRAHRFKCDFCGEVNVDRIRGRSNKGGLNYGRK